MIKLLPEICIRRPVLSIVLNLILILIGIVGFYYLQTEFLPKIAKNNITVVATYAGASAHLVETSVTTPLEDGLTGIEHVESMSSTSYQGQSRVRLTLDSEADIYEVANQVRNQVEKTRGSLPEGVSHVFVHMAGTDSVFMGIGVTATHMTVTEMRDYVERYMLNRLKQLPGIADAIVEGADPYVIQIELNPQKLVSNHLSVNEIKQAITNNSLEFPVGEVKGSTMRYPITAKTKLNTVQEFRDFVIKNDHEHVIRIQDIGTVQLTNNRNGYQSVNMINGNSAILILLSSASNANPIQASDKVRAFMREIQHQLPKDMSITTAFDISSYMKSSIHEVYTSIAITIVFVVLVILLFLGQWRTIIIPIATIPICLIASFGIMYWLGFTINVITLLALVLSIGLVVDDAIVMLENIYRHIERGESAMVAAMKGSKEIVFPVIAMTITLAAVYFPVGFVQNRAANVFKSFAFTLSGAVIISGFVALTLSPMMCSRLLTVHKNKPHRYLIFLERFYEKMAHDYRLILSYILKRRFLVLLLTTMLVCMGWFLVRNIPTTFVPREDTGLIFTVMLGTSGQNIQGMEKDLKQMDDIIRQNPEVLTTTAFADTNPRGRHGAFTRLANVDHRQRSTQAIVNTINQKINTIPGLNAVSFPISFNRSMGSSGAAFKVMQSGTYRDLYQLSQHIIKQLSQYPGLINLSSDIQFNSQQYQMSVNRALAAQSRVNVRDIDVAIANLYGGNSIATFNMQGKMYDVYMQMQKDGSYGLDSIDSVYLRNTENKLIPLTNLIHFTPVQEQNTLPHYRRLRSAGISGELASGYPLSTVIHDLQTQLPKILPKNAKYDFVGAAHQLLNTNSSMLLIFLLAIVFIYLVLSAQFESFLDPLVILLVIPLSMIGAIAALRLIGGSLNLYTDIGLVTLIGLISKHGILITQFANQLQKQGLSIKEALLQAASIRLRPILMTTAAMMFGALPLLFTDGSSAASRHQIGIVLVGGLLLGTFFSLVVIPVAYSYANQLRAKVSRSK